MGLAELPDVKEMLELLIEERVPLIYWTRVAVSFQLEILRISEIP